MLLLFSLILQIGLGTPSISWSSEVVESEEGKNVVVLKAELPSDVTHIEGTVDYIPCVGNACFPPSDWSFDHYIVTNSSNNEIATPLNPFVARNDGVNSSSSSSSTSSLRGETSSSLRGSETTAAILSSTSTPSSKVNPSLRGETSPSPQVASSSLRGSETTAAIPSNNPLWALILEAILWGFAMLLTPCVFPMVPMTISFFLKGSKTPRQGRFKAISYGLFIVLLYTIPISVIIGLTWLVGGSSITADIFNWLSTHWLPNIIFFLVFLVFAASFFGAFEIVLPSKWTNSADQKSDKAGLGGVFFLALTLVLVSFSCTGPIVGTVLIKSTQGEFWMPMLTMLAFSVAFALPFTIFALFPSLIKKLPKSGSWLNSVKVVLGFVELALGLKFLSTADQTYHWGLLNRDLYLAIWIVIFILLGLYLLGKIRFKNDEKLEYISVKRLLLVIIDFTFVLYLIPGLWGAPLKAISGYLPPLESQQFVLGANTTTALIQVGEGNITIAHNLKAFDNLEDGFEAAKRLGKRVFVDVTGHGCTNCREMEARVWSDPRVLDKLRNDFVIVALYVDDKTQIPENQQITDNQGRKLKDIGKRNSYIALSHFGVNSQPNYLILNPDGEILKGPRAYNLDIDSYLEFLK